MRVLIPIVVFSMLFAACQQTGQSNYNSAANGTKVKVEDEAGDIIDETQEEAHWSYTGETGPSHWAQLGPDFEACADQTGQSPVQFLSNLNDVCPTGITAPTLNYTTIKIGNVVNNGHTVEFIPSSDTYTLSLNGDTYTLVQFHLHASSEHQIDGNPMAMEIHFVHKNKAGKAAVLGVLADTNASLTQSPFTPFWSHVTADTLGILHAHPASSSSPLGTVNMNQMLPSNPTVNAYTGSLTTPPCTPGVQWFVYQTAISLTDQDYQQFSQQIGINARPVQHNNTLCPVQVSS